MAARDQTGTWVTYAEGQPQVLRIRRFRLSVVGGPETGRNAVLDRTWVCVGAREGCDLVLAGDPRVSGHHLEIRLDERGFRLRDLDSTNGTWVAGHRAFDLYLNPGTVIGAGDSRIRFEPLDDSVPVELSDLDRFGALLGRSAAMRALFARLDKIARADSSVLITGETGTGKELVAEAIHQSSPRAGGPLVVVDCGAVPANLIASELFGHEKGAFTGAVQSYAGAFERAHGGTVFLDELGELPVDVQPALLGVLERRQVRRVGGKRTIPVDIRVIAATNRDLVVEMNRGTFRDDLYYRLAVVRLDVPPLRQRLEDVPMLAEHFLSRIPGGESVRLRPETLERLCRHDYPGNVRELCNLIERSVILADGGDPRTLTGAAPAGARSPPEEKGGPVLEVPIDIDVSFKVAKRNMVEAFERRYLTRLLQRHGGNVSQAARAAGLDRMTVHKLMGRLGLGSSRR